MGRGRVVETELMPRLVVGYTEPDGGKLKKCKGFWKPNFGVGLSWANHIGGAGTLYMNKYFDAAFLA